MSHLRAYPTGRRQRLIALEGRLRDCPNVLTLGVKPNFADYDTEERLRILSAEIVYYPSTLYAELLHAMGKMIFPSLSNYLFSQDKIKQTALFELLDIPHPTTRFFFGSRQKMRIQSHFRFPFIGKIPRGSSMGKGVFLIHDEEELARYNRRTHVAYIQEYLPAGRDIRVVVIGKRVAHAYWRRAAVGEFRSNLAAGGDLELADVPKPALELALETARLCDWNDVGIDLLPYGDKYYVLEANMKYGRAGFRKAGLNYHRMMACLLENGEI